MIAKETKHLIIDAGATFTHTFTARDSSGNIVDLNNYDGYAQIRLHHNSSTYTDVHVSIDVGSPATGQYTISLQATETEDLTEKFYVYDVKLWDVGASPQSTYRTAEGRITVNPQVSRVSSP